VSLAILFLTASCSQASTIDLAKSNSPPTTPSVLSGPISGSSEMFHSYTVKSIDPDGDQVKYTFDWGDGTASTTNLVNPDIAVSVSHKWTVPSGAMNVFSLRVKATDSLGMDSGWSNPLRVSITGPVVSGGNNPPTTPLTPSGPSTGSSGIPYSFSTKSSDPDGDRVKYAFDWGDGTASVTSFLGSGASESSSHIWTVAPGSTRTFSVRSKATDEKGLDSGWSAPLSVTITGPAILSAQDSPTTPSAPSGPTTGYSGVFYSFTTKASNPSGGQIRYTFDWGDGTAATTCLVNPDSSIMVSNKWTVASGSKAFDIRVKAMDEKGIESSWSDPLSITITNNEAPINSPPSAPSTPTGSTSGDSGSSYTYSTRATDPDGDRVKYTFDWGDGSISDTSLVSSGSTASTSHAWTVPSGSTRTFSVRSKATDDKGLESGWSSVLSVTITGPAPVNNPPATPSTPSGSTSGSSGSSYSYSTRATDPDGDRVKYTFDWGDGSTSDTSLVSSGSAAITSHAWTVPSGSTRTFSVRSKATDDKGLESGWSNVLSVTITGPAPANNPPATPSIPAGPTTGSSGIPYSFSTKSSDPDGDRVKYAFDWGDGTASFTSFVGSGVSESSSHIWTVAPGSTRTFSVRSKATDERGLDSGWSAPLSVTITGPAIPGGQDSPTTPSVPSGPTTGYSGVFYSFITKASNPSGGQIRYTFDWGDGTAATTCLVNPDSSIMVSNKWTVASGSKAFDIRVKAMDEKGIESSWSDPLSITITNNEAPINSPPSAPSTPSGSTSGDSGSSYTYSTRATDPDGDRVKYTFDWGDESTSVTSLVSSGSTASTSHTWTVPSGSTRTFSVRSKATDEKGLDSDWSRPLSVTITGPAPVNNPPATPSTPTGSTSGDSGSSYTYSTRATDPDGDRVKYTFDWGDGSTSVTSLVSSGSAVSTSHIWTVASGSTRTFSVRSKATDENGLDSDWSRPLSVTITGPAPVNNPPATPSTPTGSTSGDSGSSYTYSTRATDPDGDRVKYTFDWGDGSTSVTSLVSSGSTASTSHIWTVASGSTRTFSVRSKATDENGLDSDWSRPLSVTITGPAPVNNPPATPSTPSGSTSGDSGSSYTYSTRATDPDGDRVKYTFDWGDGSTSVTSLVSSGSTASTSHSWTVPSGSTKTFSVRSKATDENGLDSDWSSVLSVTITGPAPVNNPPATPSTPSGSTSGDSGSSYTYSTRATDPDGDRVKYTFDWGDGSTSVTSLVSSGSAVSTSHSWTVPSGSTRTFSVRTRATDEKGLDSDWSRPLSVTITGPAPVNNPPATPSTPSGSTSGDSGSSYTYSTRATDPDGDRVKYTFDWGDGSTSVTSLVNSGSTASTSHTWTVASGSTRTFSVRSRATDEKGLDSGWSSVLSVTITGPAPVNNPPAAPSTPSGSTSGDSGSSYTYSTRTTDPDGDRVKYTFDWGDGSTSVTSLVSSGSTASTSHTWTVPSGSTRTFSVRSRATDEKGLDSDWSRPLSVTITGPAPVNNPPATPSTPSGSTSGDSGSSYTYSTRATDPDGDRVKYTFDWGDGSTSVTSLVNSGSTASTSHTWTVASGSTRTFSVRSRATDEKGLDSGWSSALAVTIKGPMSSGSNRPPATPSIPEGATTGYSGIVYKYTTKATDPDGDDVKYTFDWGDGSSTTTSLVGSGTSASASHKWNIAPGTRQTFDVIAKATDIHGASSSWSISWPVIIVAPKENTPPTIPSIPSGPTYGISGKSYDYSTSSIDADGDLIKYFFDWGDGSTETGYFPSGQVVTVSHSWNVPPGSTNKFNVRALSADSKDSFCPPPYWSDPLVVTITGVSPSTSGQMLSSQALSSKVEENETIYTQTEKDVLKDISNNFDNSHINAQIDENKSIDSQIEEDERIDSQIEEDERIDSQIEEDESIDSQIDENENIDTQTEEDCCFAEDDTFTTSTGNELRINPPGVLENDLYGSNKCLSVTSFSQPAHATSFTMDSDGSFTYTSSQDYCGEDSFTYTIDGDCGSTQATVTIFVECDQQNDEEELTY